MIGRCIKCLVKAVHTDEDMLKTHMGISMTNPKEPDKYYYCKKCKLMNVYCQGCNIQHTVYPSLGINWRKYVCKICNKERCEDVQENTEKYFEEFQKTSKYWKRTKLLTPEEFDKIYEYLKDKDSGIWCKTILGLGSDNKFPLMLTSDQAVTLLDYVHKNSMPCEKWRYDNVIGSSVLNPDDKRLWKYGVYYQYYGSGRYNTPELLKEFWEDHFNGKSNKTFNCKAFDICDCSICLETVTGKSKYVVCLYCNNIFHKECFSKHIASGATQCPLCREELTMDDLQY